MGLKFDMEDDALVNLGKKTQTSGQELGALLKQLVAAGEPLEGRFNGAGRAEFDRFKGRTDEITAELNAALHAVLEGVSGMERAFAQGDAEAAETFAQGQSGVSFDAARFSGGR